eukprot:gnl/TRDRNA2_/TRDRNA2_170338_c0_seq2.p1 gnl/TRDRNA2_/TRDRNA2_170338_c0~~gnl/TRDRNA2_/TRDRNA2_170338_c0_seq2.p1  ORF type:complete len:1313 (-),score=226.34 gnl/TRDRNA2_/TRDRNA2_170338_c0_seq2:98-4036(-)
MAEEGGEVAPQDVTAEAAPDAADKVETPLITPNRFEKAVVDYPCGCCCCWLFFALLWTMLAQAMMASGAVKFDERGVWDVRTSVVQSRWDAFVQARAAYGTNESKLPRYAARTVPLFPVLCVFYTDDKSVDLLSAEYMNWMRDVEDQVMNLPSFQDYCQISTGVDDTVDPYEIVDVNAATDELTATRAPPHGSTLIFKGSSPSGALISGGSYVVHSSDSSGNAFKLIVHDLERKQHVVDLTGNDVSDDARLHATMDRCSSSFSSTNYVYRFPELHKELMCDAYAPTFSAPSGQGVVPVFLPQCGCDESSVGHTDMCMFDCSDKFGMHPMCMSPAYEKPTLPKLTDADVKAEIGKLCEKAPGLDAIEVEVYKFARKMTLPSDWECGENSQPGRTDLVRSLIWIGGPVQGYDQTAGSSLTDQTNELIEWGGGTKNAMGQSNQDGFLHDVQKIQNAANDKMEGKAKAVVMSTFLLSTAYTELMAVEGLYAFGSIWFVWAWVWCSTGSSLLAGCCIFETLISLPMSIALWGMLGQGYVGFLCIMMLFVILGIGADDVFVLFDAYKQSAQMGFGDVYSRFAWAYRRAGTAMFTTTLTTVFCFCAAGFAAIPSISAFGWFAAFVVLWDYFLVMTLFASAVMVYHFYFERKNGCCGHKCCISHMCCCPISCIKYNKDVAFVKQPKLYGPAVPIFLLGLVACIAGQFFFGVLLICTAIIYMQAIVSSQEDKLSARPIEYFFENTYYPFARKWKYIMLGIWVVIVLAMAIIVGAFLRLPEESEKFLSEDHWMQRFFDSGLRFNAENDARMQSMFVVFGMTKEDPLNRDGVDYQQPGSNWATLIPEDPLGEINYNAGGKQALFSAAGQQEVITTCDAMRSTDHIAKAAKNCELVVWKGQSYPRLLPDLEKHIADGDVVEVASQNGVGHYKVPGGNFHDIGLGFCGMGVYCFMYDVRDYLVHFCDATNNLKADVLANPNYGSEYGDLCIDAKGRELTGGPDAFPSENFEDVITSKGWRLFYENVLRDNKIINKMAYDELARTTNTGVGLDSDGNFKFAWIGLNSTLPNGAVAYAEQQVNFDKFTTFFDSNLQVNSEAFPTAFMFNWMMTIEALLYNTIQSVLLAFVFCWIVLCITTWNILVGSITVVAVVIIVIVSAGVITSIGWTLGIIESIACIVIIGVSVDYSVHIAHAYKVSEPGSSVTDTVELRHMKARSSLGTIGISLVSGLLTSLGSTLFLWFCSIMFFRKFGMFIFLTLLISFFVTFTFLVPVLMIIGPTGTLGDLPRCGRGQEKQEGQPGSRLSWRAVRGRASIEAKEGVQVEA